MFLPNLGANEDPVNGEEGAEQEGDGERAQHVPVEDVHADEVAYLGGRAFPRCHCVNAQLEILTFQWRSIFLTFGLVQVRCVNTLAGTQNTLDR